MKPLGIAVRIVCWTFAALFALTAVSAFVALEVASGLFFLILASVCLYFAALRQKVMAARERRIEYLRIAARADAQHQSDLTGQYVPPGPIAEPPKRGKLAGVGVGATLLVVAFIGGSRLETPVETGASGSPETSATFEPSENHSAPTLSVEADDAPAEEGQSVPTADPTTEQAPSNAAVATTATVTQVIDGDTIEVRDDAKGELTIRILGIDTPETEKPGYTEACWGPEASAWAQEQLSGERVALVSDPTQDTTDAYGRTLAYIVKPDGWGYSVEAARAGVAKSYVSDTPVTQHPRIVEAEQEAMAADRGLWGPPCNGNTESVPKEAVPAPAPTYVEPEPEYVPPAPVPVPSEYYPNCTAAKAAGAAPLYAGSPGYRLELDRDKDGVACET